MTQSEISTNISALNLALFILIQQENRVIVQFYTFQVRACILKI